RLGWKTIQGHKTKFSKTRLALNALLFIVTTALITLYFPETRIFEDSIHVGGFLGLVTSKALVAVFNTAGVAIILWSAAAVLLVFYTEHTISENFSILMSLFRRLSLESFTSKLATTMGPRIPNSVRDEGRLVQEKK